MVQLIQALTSFLSFSLVPKVFTSGKKGFGAYGKLSADGKTYQVSLNVVEIQPK